MFVGHLLLLLLQIIKLFGQQTGDVRLDKFGVNPKGEGRLDIFLTDWISICYEEFNHTAATVACRQMGYCRHSSFEKATECKSKYVINIQYN